MGADKAAENTPNAPKFTNPNCLHKPKSLGFWWKNASLGIRSPWIKWIIKNWNTISLINFWLSATIVEEPNQEDLATSSAACSALSAVVDKTKVVTSAEVLPRKLSFARNSGGKLDEDDLSRIEQELFRLDKSSNDPFNSSQVSQKTNASNRSETETVINELFGEEFEKMDRDRLADRYDVLG